MTLAQESAIEQLALRHQAVSPLPFSLDGSYIVRAYPLSPNDDGEAGMPEAMYRVVEDGTVERVS
jgi:hypothetical protein